MLFLAAAVSDFHVPREKLREHKLESGRTTDDSAGLTLHLDEVNKHEGMILCYPRVYQRRRCVETDMRCLGEAFCIMLNVLQAVSST